MPSTGAISPRRTGRQAPLCAIRDVTERELNGLRQSTQTSACASQRARHCCFIERNPLSRLAVLGRRPCRRKRTPCSRNSSCCPGRSPLPPTQGPSRFPGGSSVPVAEGPHDTAACTSIADTCDFHAETSIMRMALRVRTPERSSFGRSRASFRHSHRPLLWGSLLVASNGSHAFDRTNRHSTVVSAPDC